MVDLDIELKKCLSVENPDLGMALDFLEEFARTSVSQLMFKKQPQVVETIRYLVVRHNHCLKQWLLNFCAWWTPKFIKWFRWTPNHQTTIKLTIKGCNLWYITSL
jgi:hypothetical protein